MIVRLDIIIQEETVKKLSPLVRLEINYESAGSARPMKCRRFLQRIV